MWSRDVGQVKRGASRARLVSAHWPPNLASIVAILSNNAHGRSGHLVLNPQRQPTTHRPSPPPNAAAKPGAGLPAPPIMAPLELADAMDDASSGDSFTLLKQQLELDFSFAPR